MNPVGMLIFLERELTKKNIMVAAIVFAIICIFGAFVEADDAFNARPKHPQRYINQIFDGQR